MILPVIMFAGNEDRVGEAGAYELLINPFPRSAGWGLANMSQVSGFEAIFLNPAGAALQIKLMLVLLTHNGLKALV